MGRKSTTEKRERIRVGSVSLALFRHSKGWRFSWKCPDTGVWKYGTRSSRADAVAAAHLQALTLQRGVIDLDTAARDPDTASILRRVLEMQITHSDLDRLAGARALPRVTLGTAVEQFIAAKTAARGPSARNLRTLRSHLDGLADTLGADTQLDQVNAGRDGHRPTPLVVDIW